MSFFLLTSSTAAAEFASLSRACKGEENVSVEEIKKELIKAIEVMQNKLDVNDRLTDVLSRADWH
ncbi:MAG: hypothetical protein WAM14_05560 [Candidatus Nitrosopolaris sp.]